MTDTFNFLQALADYGQACVDGRIAHDRTMALEAEFIAADKAWWDARKRIITLQDQMAAALAAAKAATLPIVSTDRMQWLLNLQVGDRVRCQFQDGHGDGEIKEIHKRLADVGLRIEFTAYVCMDADVRDVGKDVLLFSGSDLSPIPVEDPKPAEVPAPPTPAATAKDESLENLEPGAHIGQSVLDGVFSDALTGLGAAYLLTTRPGLAPPAGEGERLQGYAVGKKPDTAAQAVAQLESGLPLQPQLPNSSGPALGSQKRVLAYFNEHASEILTPLQVANAMGWVPDGAHKILSYMCGAGQIARVERGRYVSLQYRAERREADPVKVAKADTLAKSGRPITSYPAGKKGVL